MLSLTQSLLDESLYGSIHLCIGQVSKQNSESRGLYYGCSYLWMLTCPIHVEVSRKKAWREASTSRAVCCFGKLLSNTFLGFRVQGSGFRVWCSGYSLLLREAALEYVFRV